ncbi:MAG: NADH-quinone oxidoreductase subunit J [Verrucomicrobia bacterium]|nr:NADH-quinone oxidoreductase subunit J [Verrucomicrobiota bacterium]
MNTVFFIAAGVAVISTLLVICHSNAVHALLYLIISFSAVAVIFYLMGAPFVAALEVIIYAGAIIVLFLFVVMMLNLGPVATAQEKAWLQPRMWIGPSILGAILLALTVSLLWRGAPTAAGGAEVGPRQVGAALFGVYLLAVQLAALLMLAGLVGASHLRRRELLPESETKTELLP